MGVPSGTVTFLFTDIEGSTRLWDECPDAMRAALARHDELLGRAIAAHGGYVFSTAGDGVAAAFQRSADAVAAAVDAQLALGAEAWPDGVALRVRMGLHSGEAEEPDGNYLGSRGISTPPSSRLPRRGWWRRSTNDLFWHRPGSEDISGELGAHLRINPSSMASYRVCPSTPSRPIGGTIGALDRTSA